MNRKMIVICGPPRSATTFLLTAMLKHPYIIGAEEPYGTNENPDIELHREPKESLEVLNNLWTAFVTHRTRRDGYLAVKAPGYCFGYKWFEGLDGWDCKYILVHRGPYETADSMVSHDASRRVLEMSIESTDCPSGLIGFYRTLWSQSDPYGRAILRWHWHVSVADKEMGKVALLLRQYKSRTDGKKTADKIIEFLELPRNVEMQKAMSGFYDRKLSKKKLLEIESALLPQVKELANENNQYEADL